jgi:hypothetical protein
MILLVIAGVGIETAVQDANQAVAALAWWPMPFDGGVFAVMSTAVLCGEDHRARRH